MQGKISFFDRPAKALFWFIAAVSVIWSVQCKVFQSVMGKDIVETVMWGSLGQLGHLKHPPLSGWIGYGIAVLSGYSDFAMYFAAQLFLAFGAFYVYKLARLFLDETESAASVLLLYVLFYYNPSSMKFCSHFLEAAFMPAMVYYIVLGAKENRLRDWLAAGIFSALAVLGKYSAVVVLPGCLIYILMDRERRKCFLKPGIWLGMGVGLILLLPHLVWLVQHDFCCLRHVGRRISDDKMPWHYFLQVAVVGIVPLAAEALALLLAWLPCRREAVRKNIVRSGGGLALLLTLIPVAALTLVALCGGDVVLMWYSFLASWTGLAAVSFFPWKITRNHFRNLWLLTALYTIFALIGTTLDLTLKSRVRIHADPAQIVQQAEAFWRKRNPGRKIPVVIGDRWLGGVIQFYSSEHPQACDSDDSCSLETVQAKVRREGALLIGDPEAIRIHLPDLASRVKFEYFPVAYRAVWGKPEVDDFVVGIYPGNTAEK